MKWVLAFFLCCKSEVPKPKLASTAEVTTNPEVRKEIDTLATYDSIESSQVGMAGAPSESWAQFEAVQKLATPQELAALALHENPVVRGYTVKALVSTPQAMAVEPLLADQTRVKRLDGCIGGESSVAQLVVDAARGASQQELLAAAARKPWLAERYLAMQSLDAAHADAVRPVLRAALAQKEVPKEAILAAASLGEDLVPLASHRDSAVRLEVAKELWRYPHALPAIDKLLDDEPSIARAAQQSYVRHAQAKAERVAEMLAKAEAPKHLLAHAMYSPNPPVLKLWAEQVCQPNVDESLLDALAQPKLTPQYKAALAGLTSCPHTRVQKAAEVALNAPRR